MHLFSRSSITRLSLDDKALRSKEDSSQERDQVIEIPSDCVQPF